MAQPVGMRWTIGACALGELIAREFDDAYNIAALRWAHVWLVGRQLVVCMVHTTFVLWEALHIIIIHDGYGD